MRSFLLLIVLFSCSNTYAQLPLKFNPQEQPAAPDYSLEKNWSALPFHKDEADEISSSEKWVNDSLKEADVFYIYPTIYTTGNTWCADANSKTLNKKIDTKPVKYQASVFNASARVYAPRYRQGILKCFYDTTGEGKKALAFAYEDVKRAFEYYLAHYNNGRPIIIAAHSQGSYHARRLLAEFFDTTNLKNRLVAAYVIGMAFKQDQYKNLKPCENENQTGCYVTWASYKNKFEPGETLLAGNVSVNPISWKRDTIAVSSQGSILLAFNKRYECSACIHKNILWVSTGMPLVKTWDNLHIADYNLFWFDIRKNVADRIKAFKIK